MNQTHPYQIILGPYMTEKATLANESGVYVFKVSPSSSKVEIRKSVESIYKVKVKKVNITKAQPKARRLGKYLGQRSGFKKAIVTLKPGDKIDLAA